MVEEMSRWSEYRFCREYEQADGARVLSDPEPVQYSDEPDNTVHVVAGNQTLEDVAYLYFPDVPHPERLAFVLADFQDPPIQDESIVLKPGREIAVPSMRFLEMHVFSQDRARYT